MDPHTIYSPPRWSSIGAALPESSAPIRRGAGAAPAPGRDALTAAGHVSARSRPVGAGSGVIPLGHRPLTWSQGREEAEVDFGEVVVRPRGSSWPCFPAGGQASRRPGNEMPGPRLTVTWRATG